MFVVQQTCQPDMGRLDTLPYPLRIDINPDRQRITQQAEI
jgi:hypothetical protein